MADTVDTKVFQAGGRRHIARFTNISDGTGENAVVKIDKSALIGTNGQAPSLLSIEEVKWNVQGFNYVKIAFDHTTDDEALICSGESSIDYRQMGGLEDPNSAGGTGDIVFTTSGVSSTATYDITMVVRLKD